MSGAASGGVVESMPKGKAVIGQSGGPTSVINSSLAGVIDACRDADENLQSEGISADKIHFTRTIPRTGWRLDLAVDRAVMTIPVNELVWRFIYIGFALVVLTIFLLLFPRHTHGLRFPGQGPAGDLLEVGELLLELQNEPLRRLPPHPSDRGEGRQILGGQSPCELLHGEP